MKYWINVKFVLLFVFQPVPEAANDKRVSDNSCMLLREDSLIAKAGETADEQGQGPDYPQETSFGHNYSANFYPQRQLASFTNRPLMNTSCSPYDSDYFVGNPVPQEDENAVWSKLVAMQLRKLPSYEAARLRLQIDGLILKAFKPQ